MAQYTDHAMEAAIGRMLRVGVMIAAGVVLAGGLLSLRHGGAPMPDYHQFIRERASLNSVSGLLSGVGRFEAGSVMQLGILLLIATPVLRVVMCVAGFARQRDWLYVIVSTVVLTILVYSLFHHGA